MSKLPQGWDSIQLKDLLSFVLGGDWGKDPEYNDEDFKTVFCIRGTEFRHWSKEKGMTSVARKVKSSSAEKRELKLGDILIEISGGGPDQPVGRTVLIDDIALRHNPDYPKVCTNFIRLARPKDSIDSRYLNYYLQNFYISGEVINYQGGSNNLRNLKFKEYETIQIPVAPFEDQKRIADKLDSVLAKVEAAQARLDKIPTILKRFRQSVLAAATSGELTKDWREDKGEDDWPIVSLKEVGAAFNYGSSSKSKKEGRVPVLRMGNLQEGKLDWTELVYTSDENEIEKYKLRPGDVLFNRTNSPELVGKTSIYRGEREAIYAGYLIKVQGSERLNTEYLNIQLNSPHARDYCWNVKTDGVSQSNINAQKLKAYKFKLPSVPEQVEIVRRVIELFAHSDSIEKQFKEAKKRLDKLSQSILARAFRGDLFLPLGESTASNTKKGNFSPTAEDTKSIKLDVDYDANENNLVEVYSNKVSQAPKSKGGQINLEFLGKSEVLKLLKTGKLGFSAQEIFESFNSNDFEAIDKIFDELKRLIELGIVQQIGEGADSKFKTKKR